jgi:hypothetical protein
MLNKSVVKTTGNGGDSISNSRFKKYLDLHWLEIETLLKNVTDTSSGAHSELLISDQMKTSSLFSENAANKLGKACFDQFSPGTEEHAFNKLLMQSSITDKPKSTLTLKQAAIQLKSMVIQLKGMVDERNTLYKEYKAIDSWYHYLVDGDKGNFVNKFNSLVTNKLLLDDDIGDKELTESLGKRKSSMESIDKNIKSFYDALKGKTNLNYLIDSNEDVIKVEEYNEARKEFIELCELSFGIGTNVKWVDMNLLILDQSFCDAFNSKAEVPKQTEKSKISEYTEISDTYCNNFLKSLQKAKNMTIEKDKNDNSWYRGEWKEKKYPLGYPIKENLFARRVVPDADGEDAWNPDRGVTAGGWFKMKSEDTRDLEKALEKLQGKGQARVGKVKIPEFNDPLELESGYKEITQYCEARSAAIEEFLLAIAVWKSGEKKEHNRLYPTLLSDAIKGYKEEGEGRGENSSRMPNVVMLLQVPALIEKMRIIRMQLQCSWRW